MNWHCLEDYKILLTKFTKKYPILLYGNELKTSYFDIYTNIQNNKLWLFLEYGCNIYHNGLAYFKLK